VYVLWKPAELADPAFRDALLREADALETQGACGLRISAVDEHVRAGAALHRSRLDPRPAGLACFWLECSQDRAPLEGALAAAAARWAGYLVVESRPLVPDLPARVRGARTPGFNAVSCIEPRDGLAYPDFLRHWYEVHRDVALRTQSSFAYTRNEVVRALTPGAPPWAAIVEEGFPAEALADPRAFYDWRGSEERFRGNQARMLESCASFLALDRVESHPMSEYVFAEKPDLRASPLV